MRRISLSAGVRALPPIVVVVLVVAAIAGRAHADTTFTARTDRTRVAQDESVTYEATLSLDDGRAADFRPPDFAGFRVLAQRPSQSTQVQMGGGASFMKVVYTWRYELAPLNTGSLTIAPARVRVDGRELRTPAIPVAVGSGAGVASGGAPSGAVSGPDLTSAPEAGGNFIRATASQSKVYVGQEVDVEWLLALTERQDKYQAVTEPRAEGFWTEDLPMPSNQRGLALTPRTIAGQSYLVAPLMRKALFPLRAGKLTVTPLEADIAQLDFFGGTIHSQRLRAGPLTIDVEPLPAAGRPAGFDAANPAVGRFTLDAKVDRAQVAVGEPVTLTLTVSGRGNLRQVAPPAVPALPGWKSYEPKTTVAIEPNADGQGLSGTKTVEVLLLPERPGSVTLPPLRLPFFDPAARGYETAATASLTLEATGAAVAAAAPPEPAPAASLPASAEPSLQGGDLRPLRARGPLRRSTATPLYRTPVFLTGLALPPLLFAALWGFDWARARQGHETSRGQQRRRRKALRDRLLAAERHLANGAADELYLALDGVLRELVARQVGTAVGARARDELERDLRRSPAPAEWSARVLAELERCETARFARVHGTTDEMRAALQRTSALVDEEARMTPATERAS